MGRTQTPPHEREPCRRASSERGPARVPCPDCGEEILAHAKKCKHCGSFLDPVEKCRAERMRTLRERGEERRAAWAGLIKAAACMACGEGLLKLECRLGCASCGSSWYRRCRLGFLAKCSQEGCVEQGARLLTIFPSPPRPKWVERQTLFLLAPMALSGGNPFLGVMLGLGLTEMVPDIPRWLAVLMCVGLLTIPSLAGCGLLFHKYLQYRTVVLGDKGLFLGVTAKWRGSKLSWERVQGFTIIARGVQLQIKGRPWTRWLGRLINCSEREVHDLVVCLETQGVYRGV